MGEFVSVNQRGRVLEIQINRPPANAINRQVGEELYRAFDKLQTSDDLRVGVLTGSGEKIFCAGWDLKEVAQTTDTECASNVGSTPMSWMARLKRVFAIDLSRCPNCGGELRVIGAITDPGVIARILEHMGLDGRVQPRAPPPAVCTGKLN